MKAAVQGLLAGPGHDKLVRWLKLLAFTGGAQVFMQLLSAASGFWVVRMLPVREYGLYTIVNTMLGTMATLADGGISTGIMAQGGKVWQSREQLGTVMVTGLELRRKFAFTSLLVCVPVLVFLLRGQHVGWLPCALLVLGLVPAFLASLTDSVLEIAPHLHQEIKPLQANQLMVSVLRLLSLGTLYLFPFTFVAVLANGLPRMLGNIRLRAITDRLADLGRPPDAEQRRHILAIVKRILPLSLYFCLTSQITIWLLSLVGNTSGIAQLGALGRLTMLVSLFTGLFGSLVTPRFARLPEAEPGRVFRLFFGLQGGLLGFVSLITLVVWALRYPLLQLLGPTYSHLGPELVLSIIAACLSLLESVSGSMLNSRGHVIHPAYIIGWNISLLLLSLWLFNLTQLRGALYYNILLNSVFYLFILGFAYRKLQPHGQPAAAL